MTDREESSQEDRLNRLARAGNEILGGSTANLVGATIGALIGGPVGVAAGGAAGTAVSLAWRRVGSEIAKRWLSPREESRIGAVLILSTKLVQQRLGRGEQLRSDLFFDRGTAGRSHADEVIESVLTKSQREPEERKLPYMARLLGNLAFAEEISVEMSHQLIKASEQLTYRQLCILRLASVKTRFALRDTDYRGQGEFTKDLYQVLYECLDLYRRAFINFGGKVAFGPTDVKPGSMTIQGLGADLYNLMELTYIEDDHLVDIASQLR